MSIYTLNTLVGVLTLIFLVIAVVAFFSSVFAEWKVQSTKRLIAALFALILFGCGLYAYIQIGNDPRIRARNELRLEKKAKERAEKEMKDRAVIDSIKQEMIRQTMGQEDSIRKIRKEWEKEINKMRAKHETN